MDRWTRQKIAEIVKDSLLVDQDNLVYEFDVTIDPEDIFSEDRLTEWAETHGFVHKSMIEEYKNEG